jgi:hypothetical protein
MGGACSTNGGKKFAYRLLVGKPEGKRPLGRPRRRLVDSIRMDLACLAGHRDRWRAVVNAVMILRVP